MTNVETLLEEYGDDVIAKMKKILTSNRKRATGSLINSLEYRIKVNEIEVGYESYGTFVALGRKPGSKQPPIKPLVEWLKVKRISVGNGKTKSMVAKGKKQSKEKQLESMAFAIAKTISKNGIKAVDFLAPLQVFKSSKFQKDLKNAIVADLMEALKNKK